MWTEIFAAVVGAGAGQVISHAYQKRKQKRQKIDGWYEDSISMISHGRGICESAQLRSNINYGNISKESRKLSQRLKEQVNPYPEELDSESVFRVRRLATVFEKMSAVSETTQDQSPIQAINEIFEMGQREYSNSQEANMGEAIDESTEYSPLMDEIIGQANVNTRTFGEQFGDKYNDADSIEELIEEMAPALGGSKKLVKKGIEDEILTEDWDETLSLGVRIYLQITNNLCEDAINHLSKQSNIEVAH